MSKGLWLLRGRVCAVWGLTSHWSCCRETVRREEKIGTRPRKMPR